MANSFILAACGAPDFLTSASRMARTKASGSHPHDGAFQSIAIEEPLAVSPAIREGHGHSLECDRPGSETAVSSSEMTLSGSVRNAHGWRLQDYDLTQRRGGAAHLGALLS
jgi:hypothetical protein